MYSLNLVYVVMLRKVLTFGKSKKNFAFCSLNRTFAKKIRYSINLGVEMAIVGIACGFIIFIILWLSFGRIELALSAFLPMVIGWMCIGGIMHLLGIPLNTVNSVLATVIFIPGGIYTVFIVKGLISEYAYRKKVLSSYKNSIIVSALTAFIGMGALIAAKHPAPYPLAGVTAAGMLTVMVTAWTVPPVIFGWLVNNMNQTRRTPATIGQFVRTGHCAVVYLIEIAIGCFLGVLTILYPWDKDRSKLWLHNIVYKVMRFNISHIWGVKTYIRNAANETFSGESIIISNHQSILDPIFILALNPRIVMVVGGKVWSNPVVHVFFRFIGFINANQPIEKLTQDVENAIKKGYNVAIFPEGRRNVEEISRFHRGAFYMAQTLKVDIIPLYLHGVGHIMPKSSGFASRGQIDLEVGTRIPYGMLSQYGSTPQQIAFSIQESFIKHYDQMRKDIEDTHYFHDYVIGAYTYKGFSVGKKTRYLLSKYKDFSTWIDRDLSFEDESRTVTVYNSGLGHFPLLFALVHPDVEVYSYTYVPDEFALATACAHRPRNLHICLGNKNGDTHSSHEAGIVYDYSQIVNDTQ